MKLDRRARFVHAFAVAAVAVVAMCAAASAAARDNVYWSVGVAAAPGVTIGAGNYRPPVYVAPAPVYYAPAPVYYEPAPVYYVRPAPVYYGPTAYYYGGHHHNHKWKSKRKHWKHG
jgi:hypothetical protein